MDKDINLDLSSIQQLLLDQKKHQKKVLFHTRLRTLATLLSVVVVVFAVIQLLTLTSKLTDVDFVGISQSLDELVDTTQVSVTTAQTDLSTALSSFSSIDFVTLNSAIRGIAAVDYASLSMSIKKLESIDFVALNNSIDALNSIVSPLARLMGTK